MSMNRIESIEFKVTQLRSAQTFNSKQALLLLPFFTSKLRPVEVDFVFIYLVEFNFFK